METALYLTRGIVLPQQDHRLASKIDGRLRKENASDTNVWIYIDSDLNIFGAD